MIPRKEPYRTYMIIFWVIFLTYSILPSISFADTCFSQTNADDWWTAPSNGEYRGASFNSGMDCVVDQVTFYLHSAGGGHSGAEVKIFNDNAGEPDSVIDTCTHAGAISGTDNVFTCSGTVQLDNGGRYYAEYLSNGASVQWAIQGSETLSDIDDCESVGAAWFCSDGKELKFLVEGHAPEEEEGGGDEEATTTTTNITISQDNQDLFNGFLTFFLGMWTIIWIFKKR